MRRLTGMAMVFAALAACSTAPETEPEKAARKAGRNAAASSEVNAAITRFKDEVPVIRQWFDDAYGYAVFPSVGKGGVGGGAAGGRGQVFQKDGTLAGHTSLSVITLGFQLGGQSFAEIIFFKDKAAFDRFLADEFAFDAKASAVAANVGAATTADYRNGVAVVVLMRGGLMFEAAVGGQRFSFREE